MAKKTKIEEIIEKINAGMSRAELESIYNKGTVTKAFNQISQADVPNDSNKEDKVEDILRSLFASIKESEEYEINIKITKKATAKSKVEKKNKEIIENPFELYNELGEKKYLRKLSRSKREDVEKVIKKYFTLKSKQMSKYTIEELAEYVINEVKRNFNIGQCFK